MNTSFAQFKVFDMPHRFCQSKWPVWFPWLLDRKCLRSVFSSITAGSSSRLRWIDHISRQWLLHSSLVAAWISQKWSHRVGNRIRAPLQMYRDIARCHAW